MRLDPSVRYKFHYLNDVRAEFGRLRALGVRFTQEPADMGPVTTAVLDDSCGNLIHITPLH